MSNFGEFLYLVKILMEKIRKIKDLVKE